MRILAIAAFGLAGCAGTMNRTSVDEAGALAKALRGESQLEGRRLEQAVAAAGANPLGARGNPVRAQMPQGQHAYLRRLRCSNGAAPSFSRIGSFGPGAYGNTIDGYDVDCGRAAPGKVQVFMDMYHPGYIEPRAVPGFSIE